MFDDTDVSFFVEMFSILNDHELSLMANTISTLQRLERAFLMIISGGDSEAVSGNRPEANRQYIFIKIVAAFLILRTLRLRPRHRQGN